jgi:excisionase family DNA binding protein
LERPDLIKLYKPGEAAKLLYVDVKTLQRWSDRGWIRSIRTCGGHRRYFASDVDELLRSGSDPSTRNSVVM